MHDDLWPWPISSRPFSHDFPIRLLKYGTSCHVCSAAHTVLDWFFPYWAKMITSMRWCVVHNDLSPWPIYSRSFRHYFVIKLLKYMAYLVVSTLLHIQFFNEFFPYLVQMIISMRGCVGHNDLWPWPIYSRLSECDLAYFMDYVYIYIWHKHYPWGDDVSWVQVDHWSSMFS